MESDFFTGGYAKKHTIEQLEKMRNELHDELHGMHEHTRGLSKEEMEQEIEKIEEQIKLLKENPDAEDTAAQ